MTTPDYISMLMDEALKEATLAKDKGEVPVGAVVARGESIVGRGHNLTESVGSVTAHAEIRAINEASKNLGGWRLTDCVLCVTLEPCTMCLGAIRLARIPTIVFGAGDSRQGAVGSLYDLSQDERLGSSVRVISHVKQLECERILAGFFKTLRA